MFFFMRIRQRINLIPNSVKQEQRKRGGETCRQTSQPDLSCGVRENICFFPPLLRNPLGKPSVGLADYTNERWAQLGNFCKLCRVTMYSMNCSSGTR